MTDNKYPVGTVADVTFKLSRSTGAESTKRGIADARGWSFGLNSYLYFNDDHITDVKVLEPAKHKANDYDAIFSKVEAAIPVVTALFGTKKQGTRKPVGDVWSDVCDIVHEFRDMVKESAMEPKEEATKAPSEPSTGGVVTVKVAKTGNVKRYARGVDGVWRDVYSEGFFWEDLVKQGEITVLSEGV